FGERWEVPQDAGGPIVLRAEPRLTTAGKLTDIAYKVYPPKLRVEYEDGAVAEHVLVWRDLRSGFLVSDPPGRNGEGRMLLEGGEAARVGAISFLDATGNFEREFRAAWAAIPLDPSLAARRPLPHRDVPQPVVPSAVNQMAWEAGVGRPTGADPFV